MNDLQMTESGDLLISENDILKTDSIMQAILIRLRWWFGEWKFGPEYGVKYYEHVLVKNPNKTVIMSEITKQITQVDGVQRVENLEVLIDPKNRKVVIRYTVVLENSEKYEGEVSIWQSME